MIDFSCQDKTDELCASAREVIKTTRIAIVGMGALGTSAANALVRSGCANLVIIDDDTIEASNLPRQSLFYESDISKEKVVVAAERLQGVNKQARIIPISKRVTEENIDDILCKSALVLDCTDNLESRRIIDSYCTDKPWVHAAVIRGQGEVMAVLPGAKRYSELVKGKIAEEDCSEQGVLSIAAIMTGTFQASIALRILTHKESDIKDKLFRLDAWKGTIDEYSL